MVRHSISLLVMAGASTAFYACSSVPTTNTSTIHGTLASDSYPSVPTAVVAVDEAKTETTAAIAPDGTFTLVLAKNHHYSMHAKLETGDVPVVFPRADGTLDVGISITSGAAKFDMGALRYAGGAPAGSFGIRSTTTPVAGQTCFGGMDMRTATVCVQTTTTASCQYGPEENDGEHDDGEHDDGDGDNHDDGDHHGGADDAFAAQNAALQAADVPADSTKPMAVPENSVPDTIGGCNDGDDEEDDDDETNDD